MNEPLVINGASKHSTGTAVFSGNKDMKDLPAKKFLSEDNRKVYKQIVAEYKEYVLSKQFLKAGTSIGAMVREAEFAQSKPNFISKLSISLHPVKSFQIG